MPLPTNVIAATAGIADFFTLTAGNFIGQLGFDRNQGAGSINPDVPFFGTLRLDQDIDNGTLLFVSFFPGPVPDTDASWKSLDMTGTFAGGTGTATYIRANRTTYFADNGQGGSQWQFTLDALGRFVETNVYQCVFRR